MKDYIEKRFWTILPFNAIKHYPHLKLAPCGVVPQRERRPRPIIDYSYAGINQSSAPLAPFHSMQFGGTLQRILQRIAYANPAFGPVHLLKFDLADGYYRVPLSPQATLELAVLIPGESSDKPYIGVPLTLPMGWNQSPPYFCAFTETAADLANTALRLQGPPHPPHSLEVSSQLPTQEATYNIMDPAPSLPPGQLLQEPLAYIDVYMDDFIALAQQPNMPATLHHTIKGILQVFRDKPLPDDPPSRRHIISESKIAKGDATWSTNKTILGWSLDTARGTLQLQPHKAARLHELLGTHITKQRTSRTNWQRLLGELRYMGTAIRGAKYLFSILQHVLIDQPTSPRIRLTPLVRAALQDWQHLATTLAQTPMPISSLVPQAPRYVGAVDASGAGCGGFWLASIHGALPQPIAFRLRFPPHITDQLVSASNPSGTISNSDLELAALVLGAAILQDNAHTEHSSVMAASDNTPAVAWCTKGSTSSLGPNAYLLQWLAQLTHQTGLQLNPVSIPGLSNCIADFCSRSFHLTDQDFRLHLQNKFPIQPSWRIVTPKPEHVQQMTCALSRMMLPWASAPRAKRPNAQLSTYGPPFAKASAWTQPWQPTPTQSRLSNCSLIDTEQASYLPAELRSAVARWETPFVPLDRHWPAWDSRTPASLRRGSWTSASRGNLPNTAKTMIRRTGSNPYHSQSCNKRCRMHVTKTHHSTTPLQTSSSSASSSSCGRENTPPRNRRTHRHFASGTSNCSTTPDLWRTQRLATALSNQTLSASRLPNRKTESEERWSGWVHPETQPSVRSHPYKTAFNTYSDWGPRRLPLYTLTT